MDNAMVSRLFGLSSLAMSAFAGLSEGGHLNVIGGADISGDGMTVAVGEVDVMTGHTAWGQSSLVSGGDEFCTGAFANKASVFYMISPTDLLKFNSSSGEQIFGSKPLSLQYDLIIGGYDAATAMLWGVGSLGEGPFDIITVVPTSGKVEVVKSNIVFDSVGNCEAASAAALGGAFYFDTQASGAVDELVRFDLHSKAYSKPMPYPGTIWGVSSWVPVKTSGNVPGLIAATPAQLSVATTDHALVLGNVKNSAVTELASMDPTTGERTHLLFLNSSYSAQQGSFTFDAASGCVYAVIQGPHSLVTYSVAVLNLTVSPPTAHYAHIPDSKNSKYGIFNPALALAA